MADLKIEFLLMELQNNILIRIKNILKPYYLPYLHRLKKWRNIKALNANGNEVLKVAKAAFDEVGVFFWLDFGTLLGAHRDGRLISHDSDIDVAVFLKDYNPKIKDTLLEHGFSFQHRIDVEGGAYGLEESFRFKNVGFDIFYYIQKGNKMYCHLFPLDKHKNRIIRELQMDYSGFRTIDFLGEQFNVPKNTEQRLIDTYGKEYLIPIKDWHTPNDALNSTIISKTYKIKT